MSHLIPIRTIPNAGLDVTITGDLPWVKDMLKLALPRENPDLSSVKGHFLLSMAEANLSLNGNLSLVLNPLCDRCGETGEYKMNLPLHMHVLPPQEGMDDEPLAKGQEWEEEITFSGKVDLGDDLDVSFYNGTDVDIKRILSDAIVISLPLQFLCKEDCAGLCLRCGTNKNFESCDCEANKPIDPRWEALKKLKN